MELAISVFIFKWLKLTFSFEAFGDNAYKASF